ncbi:MAG: hypothetical protein Q7U85_07450, partial [Rhodocyclaceae bacterium]|nr:hypothetical protein [Rhodocyclaceae bacterium]
MGSLRSNITGRFFCWRSGLRLRRVPRLLGAARRKRCIFTLSSDSEEVLQALRMNCAAGNGCLER